MTFRVRALGVVAAYIRMRQNRDDPYTYGAMPVRIWTTAREMRISAKTGLVCLVQMLDFDPGVDLATKDGPLAMKKAA